MDKASADTTDALHGMPLILVMVPGSEACSSCFGHEAKYTFDVHTLIAGHCKIESGYFGGTIVAVPHGLVVVVLVSNEPK